MGDSSVAEEESMAAASKVEPGDDEGTPSSIDTTPDPEALPELSQEPTAQPAKRKGGRKPIYATSEERKQRNRQAQAAFRERRTEYIKQLEAQIKQNEDSLSTLQQSHRTAADECLMLRYKNSLLERILLEKGVDVQNELRIKSGSPILPYGYGQPAANIAQAQAPRPPLQRTALQRQHARRSGGQVLLPQLAPGQATSDPGFTKTSPLGHPTPSSHSSSPVNLSNQLPMNLQQNGATPPASTMLSQQQLQHYNDYTRSPQLSNEQGYYPTPQQQPQLSSQYHSNALGMSNHASASQHAMNLPSSGPMHAGQLSMTSTTSASSAAFPYPSPFQKHIDQLEQEYDTEPMHSMLEPTEHDTQSISPPHQLQGIYPSQVERQQKQQRHRGSADFYQQSYGGRTAQQMMAPHPHFEHSKTMNRLSTESAGQESFTMGQVDPSDPLLDADPFGLSASMHYPTSYSTMAQGPQSR